MKNKNLRFRDLVVVESTSHGSQIDNYAITRDENNVRWICIRPKRSVSALEFDVKEEGFSRVPVVLFGSKPASCYRDEEGKIWYANFPESHEILSSFISCDFWIDNLLEERRKVFDKLKTFIDSIHEVLMEENIKQDVLTEFLKNWKKLCSLAFPYMFLALMTDDLTLNYAKRLLKKYNGSDNITLLFQNMLRSTYSKNAIKSGKFPTLNKSLMFPPRKLFKPIGGIDRTLYLDNPFLKFTIEKCCSGQENNYFLRLIERTSLAFQISEENFYVMGALTGAIENLLFSACMQRKVKNPVEEATVLCKLDITGVIKYFEQNN